jgi:putative tricarboxylic transport membrane protein
VDHVALVIQHLAQPLLLLLLPLAVLAGMVIGAIPGLTSTMAVGVLLPFTLFLDPLVGILILIGIGKGSLFGGSISAILMNVPGTPAAACTVLDGYPLARKGQAGRAIETALWSSFIGDLLSVVALVLLASWLAQFGQRFGPKEFFALILLSLTVIAALSQDSLPRAIAGGLLGLLLGTVGLDLVNATPRFTFGSQELTDGVPFLPVLIGLFALPDIIEHYMSRTKEMKAQAIDRTRFTRADFRMTLPTILKGSAIGITMGAIPGIGATASTFVSYAEAKRSAPDRDEFGTGALSGVAAAESANSGTKAATLIPLLALGVPGDVVTAILLGAFYFHGLAPGPLLFSNDLPFIHALYIALFFSGFFILLFGYLLKRWMTPIASVPRDLLYPPILVLCIVGAYALSNSMFAVFTMFLFGIMGVFLRRLRIPAPTILIGFVLSTLLEDNLRRALLISRGQLVALLDSPLAMGLHAATAVVVVAVCWRAIRRGRLGKVASPVAQE